MSPATELADIERLLDEVTVGAVGGEGSNRERRVCTEQQIYEAKPGAACAALPSSYPPAGP